VTVSVFKCSSDIDICF